MKRLSFAHLGVAGLVALATLSPTVKADEYNRKTVISISQPLEVPGVVLPPGKYVMKLFNSSSNRHIVQFMNEDQNQQLALTFAVSAERIRPTGKTVLTTYEGSRGAPPALRTWFYPGDTVGQEFLYPRQQAVQISERTNAAVPEIETGKPVTADAAEPAKSSAQSNTQVLIARAEPVPEPIPEPEPQQPAAESQRPEPVVNLQPVVSPQPIVNPQPAAVSSDSLPQTAGEGPLAALLGGLSVILAFGMRKLKLARNR